MSWLYFKNSVSLWNTRTDHRAHTMMFHANFRLNKPTMSLFRFVCIHHWSSVLCIFRLNKPTISLFRFVCIRHWSSVLCIFRLNKETISLFHFVCIHHWSPVLCACSRHDLPMHHLENPGPWRQTSHDQGKLQKRHVYIIIIRVVKLS